MISLGDFVATLDKRFFSSIWLPVQVAWLGLVLIAISPSQRSAGLGRFTQLAGPEQAGVVVFIIALGTLAAYLMNAQLRHCIRFFEGRWPREFNFIAIGMSRRQRRRRQRLLDRRDSNVALLYPSNEGDVLPTLLGNVLRAGEMHSWERYRLDAKVFWPRLYACAPEAVRAQIAVLKGQLDFLVLTATLSLIFGLVGPVLAFSSGRSIMPVLLTGIVGGTLSIALYRAACSAASDYALGVRSTFDIYRFAVLDELGWSRPESLTAERRQWQAIAQLWLRGGVGSADQLKDLGYVSDRAVPQVSRRGGLSCLIDFVWRK